jgi:hypothetical protein
MPKENDEEGPTSTRAGEYVNLLQFVSFLQLSLTCDPSESTQIKYQRQARSVRRTFRGGRPHHMWKSNWLL